MWDERYAEAGFVYGTEPNAFLRQVMARLPVGRALSLAEGEGRNAVFMAEHGFEVTAVDGSAVGLAKAQQLAQERGVSIRTEVADLADYAIEPESYQVITSIYAHLLPEAHAKILHAACQGLSTGGMLLLVQYHPDQLKFGTGGPREIERLPDMEQLQAACHGIEWLIAEHVEIDVQEGARHSGMSSVIHLLGLKQ
ncbi:MAG: class I SAM-dependent methyltransferase [Neisseria sp.]|nr:class I SAM-dependent methyltransferase [Neisseria sp.]